MLFGRHLTRQLGIHDVVNIDSHMHYHEVIVEIELPPSHSTDVVHDFQLCFPQIMYLTQRLIKYLLPLSCCKSKLAPKSGLLVVTTLNVSAFSLSFKSFGVQSFCFLEKG